MAIAFARQRYIARRSGGNVARSAAYNARAQVRSEYTGQTFSFRHRDGLEHHEVALPADAPPSWQRAERLWQAAQAAEKRKDSQEAREIVLALPHEVTREQRIELVREFVREHVTSKGLAAQIDLHLPHKRSNTQAHDERNFHAHILITTRRINADGFGPKARDLDPTVRGGRAFASPEVAWGELWRRHQNSYFEREGIDLAVDSNGIVAQRHAGPRRFRPAEPTAEDAQVATANRKFAEDPVAVMRALTARDATVTNRDLDRFLAKHIHDQRKRIEIRLKLAAHSDFVRLSDDRGPAGRWTTRSVLELEKAATAAADQLAQSRNGAASTRSVLEAMNTRTLRTDQQKAVMHATGTSNFAIIEGRAGVGKSYAAAAIREAYEQDGRTVIGLAPTNIVANDMKKDGFSDAKTVAKILWDRDKHGETIPRRAVLVVDEAGMLDHESMSKLLKQAAEAEAKVILVGDSRQLASVGKSGLFADFADRHGSAEIDKIVRQKVEWQREAATDFAAGRHRAGIARFEAAGAIHWAEGAEQQRASLVRDWTEGAKLGKQQFVFAVSNKDVDQLNTELRAVLQREGKLSRDEVTLKTDRGERPFSVGERVIFSATDKRRGFSNGEGGTMEAVSPTLARVRLDNGKEISFDPRQVETFRHGYAGTVYKGQGRTLDRTFILHSKGMRAASTYVALTRQRDEARIYVDKTNTPNLKTLARQVSRSDAKHTAGHYAKQGEGEAIRPTSPAQAIRPATPAPVTTPAQTNQPAAPTAPTQVTTPATPAQPIRPAAPTGPAQAQAPAQPIQPAAPTTPAQAQAPAQPIRPAAPTAPTQATAPANPATRLAQLMEVTKGKDFAARFAAWTEIREIQRATGATPRDLAHTEDKLKTTADIITRTPGGVRKFNESYPNLSQTFADTAQSLSRGIKR